MMKRRDFVRAMAGAAVAGCALDVGRLEAAEKETAGGRRFLLSRTGCGRATGYAETNKIVTVRDKTHVAWLDSVAEGFRVRVRTLDRKTGAWSPTFTVGEAYDNHGGPALTVDGRGYLHIVYYPHHHPFRYRRSVRPNDASQWSEEAQFGKRCTYPTLLCGPDDTLYLTCRESSRTEPWVVNLYTKSPGGEWSGPRAILQSDQTGYSHFQEALAWGPDHRTLHLSARFYSGKPGRGHTVGYLGSPDAGRTWERADGTRVVLPATAETVSVIARDTDVALPGYRCGFIEAHGGVPRILYSAAGDRPSRAWIAELHPSGEWHRKPLHDEIAPDRPGWGITMPGGMHFGGRGNGRVVVVLTLIKPETGESMWGHPSSEVIRLESNDGGGRYEAHLISDPDPAVAHWLPNLERPTGHNRIAARPGLIYQAGTPGDNNRQILSNEVYWVG